MSSVLSFVPFVFFILWLGIIVYVILLGTRLVNAVEQIARAMTARLSDSPKR
jgi:uncharacterized BrkB/YihY/UPF0761 family membrane protein